MREFGEEAWGTVWPEAKALAAAHAQEVEVQPHRKHEVDEEVLGELVRIGMIKVHTARVDKVLVGYLTWLVVMDTDCKGMLVANQGAWFVRPGAPLGTAFELFEFSLGKLNALGVKCVFPHHPFKGRGRSLGRFFARYGGKPMQVTYSIWLGGEEAKSCR